MNKKLFSAALLSVLLLGSAGTFVSCQDYDDDIENLQSQINDLNGLKQTVSQVESNLASYQSSVQASINSAIEGLKNGDVKTALLNATTAMNDANEAKALAQAAQNAINTVTGLSEDDVKQLKWIKDNATKLEAILNLQPTVAQLQQDLENGMNTKADATAVAQLQEKVEALQAAVIKIMGHRLTSISVVPTQHINGIAALVMKTLVYSPQKYVATNHDGQLPEEEGDATAQKPRATVAYPTDGVIQPGAHTYGMFDHAAIADTVWVYTGNDIEEAYYQMSPSMGVREQDIKLPSFDCITSENWMTRGVDVNVNDPIKPVGYEIDEKTGVLTVKYEKANSELIEVMRKNWRRGGHETFPMVSLKVPVAEANWTDEEVELGDPVNVNSEYVRLEEVYYTPYLMNNKLPEDLTGYTWNNTFPDETVSPYTLKDVRLTNEQYVHYHDSLCVWNSVNEKLIDFVAPYDAVFDLTDKVAVCITPAFANDDHTNHIKLTPAEAKAYGLAFRFDIPTTPYMQGDLKTDQQKFAQMTADPTSADYGKLKSQVYTVGVETPSRTAIGREPIIRVRLIDEKNGGNLIAQRYIKIRWIELDKEIPEQTIPAIDLGTQDVWCMDMFSQLGTQRMNEEVYHEITIMDAKSQEKDKSISKERFHEWYDQIKIVELKKDGEYLIKGGKSVVNDAADKPYQWETSTDIANTTIGLINSGKEPKEIDGYENILNNVKASGTQVVFGFLQDKDPNNLDNTTYHVMWGMTPAAVGTVKPEGSVFELTVQYLSKKGYGTINQTFIKKIVVPTQEFAYQGTYWKDGQPQAGTGVFNVNPLVYKTSLDGNVTKEHTDGEFDHSLNDWSHIEADLMNGWVYTKGNKKPKNLSEFIQKIRSCAEVKFVFDEERFKDYENLKDYTTDETRTQLWRYNPNKLTAKTDTNQNELNEHMEDHEFTDKGILDYIQPDYDDKTTALTELAASISNHLFSTEETNADTLNLSWNFKETLNGSVEPKFIPSEKFEQSKDSNGKEDAAYAIIRLHELTDTIGTEAAIEQIGQKVPVNLEVAYNEYNVVPVQKFEVFFIEPLAIDGKIGDSFTDAVVNGSFIDVAKNFTFTDWNNYTVAKAAIDKPTEKQQYAHQLFDYYCVNDIVFVTDSTTTCLAKNGDTWIATEGVTDGPMPAGAMLKMMDWNGVDKTSAKKVDANPSHLAYFNNSGTPVDFMYHLYVNVNVNYKWGVLERKGLEIKVMPADGTPTNSDHK